MSQPYDLTVGTPQGSPISPILSIIYASPLLYLLQRWNTSALSMYIDDGNILACGENYNNIISLLCSAYRVCWDWLTHAGLKIEPDKMEAIFFQNLRAKQVRPPAIWLADPSHLLEY
jgi:hypothetical protein